MLIEENISCLSLNFTPWLKAWKTRYSFHESKPKKMALFAVKKLSTFLKGIPWKIMVTFTV